MKNKQLKPYAFLFGLSLLQGMSLIALIAIVITLICLWI